MKKLTLLISFFLLSIAQINAQAYLGRQDSYWELGFQANAMNYFGDLNPRNQYVSSRLDYTRPGLFVHLSRKFGSRIRVRASLGYGRISANDFESGGNYASYSGEVKDKKIARYGRNLHFRNDIQEFAVTATYDFFKSEGRYYRRKFFTPYALLGFGVFHHNPKAKAPTGSTEAGNWVALQPLGTEGQGKTGYEKKYGLIQPTALIGAGLRLRVTDRIDIGLECGVRVTFTNYLDDVGGKYADLADLDSDLARRMSDRSAEPTDAMTGNTRNIGSTEVTSVTGGVTPNYGGQPPFPNVKGQGNVPDGYNRLGSYGLKGDIRGDGGFFKQDIYITTGFHLNYILTSKRHPRYTGN